MVSRISFGPLAHTTLGFENFFRDVEKLLDMDVSKQTHLSHHTTSLS